MKNILALLLLLAIISCESENQVETPTSEPQLLFKSGFEGNVQIVESTNPDDVDDFSAYNYITGTDSETNFSWPISILGSTNAALHFIDYDDYQAVNSEIQTVIGHDGNPTKALYNKQFYDNGVTQCPYEILEISEGRKDLYIKYWMKLDTESLSQINKWRALFEYKTKDYADGTGFRLISYIYTDTDGNPYWHWQGDANPQNAVWEIDNTTVPVPINEWFLTEYYWHWSEGDYGRALWKINGQVIGDHYGPTTRNSKPIDFIILTQIYGDANPKHQWIDDIEIWDAIPE